MREAPSSDSNAFSFQLAPEQVHAFLQWQDNAFKAATEYQLNVLKLRVTMFGDFSSIYKITVTPNGTDQWQLTMHLFKVRLLPVIEPLVITQGITPVHSKGLADLTIQRNDYRRMLENKWTFAHAHNYEYAFAPSTVGVFVTFRPIEATDWIELSDVDEI